MMFTCLAVWASKFRVPGFRLLTEKFLLGSRIVGDTIPIIQTTE